MGADISYGTIANYRGDSFRSTIVGIYFKIYYMYCPVGMTASNIGPYLSTTTRPDFFLRSSRIAVCICV